MEIQWMPSEPNTDMSIDRCTMMVADFQHAISAEDCTKSNSYVCKDVQQACFQAMGVEDRSIPDKQLECTSHLVREKKP
jgi:hypothetical protein